MEPKMNFSNCMFFFVSSQHPTRERKKVLATLIMELVSLYSKLNKILFSSY